jgi:leucyl aminopeptidase (aminopeptidase T)
VTDLDTAVRTVVDRCLGIQAGENVLVICDPDRVDIGTALQQGALALGADAVLTVLPPRPERGTEPPPAVAAAFSNTDVYLAPCLPSLSHTKARKAATDKGIRGATLPGVDAELLARLMSADFDLMAQRSKAVADLLTNADEAHVTCGKGTDLRLDLQGRTAIPDDGDLTAKAAFGNLPCGEGFIAPLNGEGQLVATTVGGLGLAEEGTITLTVEDGNLVEATGATGARFIAHLIEHGDLGRNLAELGVGTNDKAKLTGNVLEDEKIIGTVHIAFGASAAIGGNVAVPVHDDCVIVDPTLTIGGTTVVDNGRFAL